jgi:hypothetical protein
VPALDGATVRGRRLTIRFVLGLSPVVWNRLLGAIVVLALASQGLTLLIAGHSAYLWVQGLEAIAASVGLLVAGLRYLRHDPRLSRWPPLLPLAAIALSGGVKDIYVAVAAPTPLWLIVILLGAVGWLVVESIVILRAEARSRLHP